MIIYLPLLICVIGALVYGLVTNNPKLETVGLHMFWVGLLAFLLLYPGHPIVMK
jgi:hypothetical protein